MPLKPLPLAAQLIDLTLIQLANFRWSWRRMIITGVAAPLASMAALGIFARESGPETLGYIFCGNLVLALMFENLGKVSSNFSFMRLVGSLNYFATLPIQRLTLVIATVAAFFILSLPALLATLGLGGVFLHVELALSPWVILALPLIALPLSGLGALIGSTSPTPEAAGATTLLVTLGLLAAGPVVIPPDRLPPAMILLGRFSPATYAVSALRQTLLGPVTGQLAMDFAALLVASALVFWLALRKMDWRQG